MLFEQSAREFSDEAFQDPAACYRGAPFWSWNTLMTKEMIEKQILEFKKMGMGGFHVHVRVGLKNQYMSDEFLELVRFCKEKAQENGMLCWLYDEDRYSSGIAGGEVTKRIAYRARWLKLTVREDKEMLTSYEEFLGRQERNEKVRGCFLRAYDIVLQDGYLRKASVMEPDGRPEGVKWYLYLELAKETPWCNDQTYVDTMKREAIASFIHLTHDRYASVLQEDFGGRIPAIFTDEPHINGLRLPKRAEGREEILLPFTEVLPEVYGEVEGKDFFAAVPCLVWNVRGEEASPLRYHYYRTISELFADAYCRQIGDWCQAHHLSSTGHLLGEDSLRGQAGSVGDAMRCYREFQLPGIDNLCDNRDFMAARQVSSIAHQYHKEGVLSELYGVTQWDFNFEGYKLAGDWQAALGINVRVPHLAWASMNGEAKRDYPAAIGWQSPWYEDYSYIENHFARVNYCLTRGKPLVRVGILHPVESFWLLQGPGEQSEGKKKQLEEEFQLLTRQLLFGGIDFDYIAESSLAEEEKPQEGAGFLCGEMKYQVVLVPGCIHLRGTTLRRLSRFAQEGGTVLFLGEPPQYVDCRRDEALRELIVRCERLPASGQALLERLRPWREVEILERGGKRTFNLLHQLREEGECRWFFLAQGYRGMEGRQDEVWFRRPLHAPQEIEIRIRGEWRAEKLDTLTGRIECLDAVCREGWTYLSYELYGDDSLLLHLVPAEGDGAKLFCGEKARAKIQGKGESLFFKDRTERKSVGRDPGGLRRTLPEPIGYRMSEPNVLLLDRFEYALDQEEYGEACELLKLDNRLRERLHLPLRCEALAQPYVRVREEVRDHKLHLRTWITSETELTGCCLALEEAEHCVCTLNGQQVKMRPRGFYVDPAITRVELPPIREGRNELCVTMDYGDCTDLEWMYLLGDFGVELRGAWAVLRRKPERLFWGDYTRQGFPFYTGNMTYLVGFPADVGRESGKEKFLQVPYYSGAAVKARLNGGEEKMLAFLPYQCRLEGFREPDDSGQDNLLEITCLGNRYNGFGQLHLIGDDFYWLGQNSWRTEGTSWTDTYQVRPMGILTAPFVLT